MRRTKILNAREVKRTTFKDAEAAFYKHCKVRNLRPQTLKYYEEDLTYFHNHVPVKYVDEITQPVIENFITDELEEGKKVSFAVGAGGVVVLVADALGNPRALERYREVFVVLLWKLEAVIPFSYNFLDCGSGGRCRCYICALYAYVGGRVTFFHLFCLVSFAVFKQLLNLGMIREFHLIAFLHFQVRSVFHPHIDAESPLT